MEAHLYNGSYQEILLQQYKPRDLNNMFDQYMVEDYIYWFSSMSLFFSMSLTYLYDYSLSTVYTGGVYYGLATAPIMAYSFLEIFLPYLSRQAYMMLLVNEYLKLYAVALGIFALVY